MRNSSSGKEAFCFLQAEDSKERVRHDVLLYLKLTIYKKICSPSLFSLLHFYVTKDIAVVGGADPWEPLGFGCGTIAYLFGIMPEVCIVQRATQ